MEIVRSHAPDIKFDYVIVNNSPINPAQLERYESEGARQIGLHNSISPQTIEGAEIVSGNLLAAGEKVRHNPEKLARVVMLCAGESVSSKKMESSSQN